MAERNMVIIIGLVGLRGEKRWCGSGSGGSELCLCNPMEYNRERGPGARLSGRGMTSV
jgi:hypothetical protein